MTTLPKLWAVPGVYYPPKPQVVDDAWEAGRRAANLRHSRKVRARFTAQGLTSRGTARKNRKWKGCK